MFQLIKLLLISGLITNQIFGTNSSIIVRYTEPYEIICEFDELKETVKWIYNAATVFSCKAPYRAGECKIQNGNNSYNIDYASNKMTIGMNKDDISNWKYSGANWTCSHGNQQETYIFDQTESPMLCSRVQPEEVLDPQSIAKITIEINSTKPYTVTWSSKRKGVIKTEEFKDTLTINEASIDIQTSCLDNVDTFTYLIDNSFSFPVEETFELKVKCETIVLEDEMNKTIEVELGQDAEFKVLYAGHIKPNNITWYRRMGAMTTDLDFLTDYRRTPAPHESHSMGIIIQSVQKQDLGTYTAELLYSETKKTLIDFELVLKSKESDPPFSWYVGIAIGAGGAILICTVIFIAVVMIKQIKFKDTNYLTPKSVPQTPPPPVPHLTTNIGSSISCNDSDFYESSENYENVTSAPYSISDVDVE